MDSDENQDKEEKKYSSNQKLKLSLFFFSLGIINHLGTTLVLTGGRILSKELNMYSYLYFYTSASTLFNILTRFINSKYLAHVPYRKRIIFLCFWMGGGFLIMYLILIGHEKKFIGGEKANIIFFLLSFIPSFILGSSYALGESAIIAYLNRFPKNLVGGFSSGTGLSGIISALLNLSTQLISGFSIKLLYLILSPIGFFYFLFFSLTEKIYNEVNEENQIIGSLLVEEDVSKLNDIGDFNTNDENSESNTLKSKIDIEKNKPMSWENFKHVMSCVGRIILNLFCIYFTQFYTLNGLLIKIMARVDIQFLPIKCTQNVNGINERKGKYEFMTLFFQIGMFSAKSMLFIAKKIKPIEILSGTVISILIFYIFEYFFHFVDYYIFFPIVLLLGFVAGSTYVAAFYSILKNENLGEEYKDVAINCATIANDTGTFLCGIIALITNNTIFKGEKLYEEYVKDQTLLSPNNCCNNNTRCPYPNSTNFFLLNYLRHGARAPVSLDENNYDLFKQKWLYPGELTVVGQRMHYLLGRHNHERYINQMNFLSKNLNSNEIYILSTNFNRTIQSALAQFQGLYYLNSSFNDRINDNQKNFSNPPINITKDIQNEINKLNLINSALPQFLQTIPIHIINNTEHEMEIYDVSYCVDKVIEYANINFESDLFKNFTNDFNNKFSKSFNKLFNQIGNYSIPYIIDLCDQFISDIYDGRNLNYLEYFYNIKLNDLENYCLEFGRINSFFSLITDNDTNLLFSMMTPFFRELLNYMKNRINLDINNNTNDNSNPKFVMFSGHDASLGNMEIFIIKAFNITDENFFVNPIYASSCFFEVYKNDNSSNKKFLDYSDYIVDYIFNDKLMKSWNFNEFYKTINSKLWSRQQIYNYCENKESNNELEITLKYIILLLLILIFGLFALLLHLIIKYLISDDSKLNKLL